MNLSILYQDRSFLVVDKPAGLLVEHSSRFPSVEDWAEAYVRSLPGKNFVGIVHRLDRAASGTLLLATRPSALRLLNEQFASRKVRKCYRAVVEAPPPAEEGILLHWLEKDVAAKRAQIYNAPQAKAAEARLAYRLIGQTRFGWLLDINLFTGRFHQIRSQLSAIGCPIVGDIKYGARQNYISGGIALHAFELVFYHPDSGEELKASAPIPDHPVWATL